MVFYKYLTLALLFTLIGFFFQIRTLGKKLAVHRDANTLDTHQSLVAGVLCLGVVTVCVIELMVRMSPAHTTSLPLQLFHFGVVGGLVIVFALMNIKYTGLYNKQLHAKLARALFILFFLASVSGAVMLYNLPL